MSKIYLLITNLTFIMVTACAPVAGAPSRSVIQINTPSLPRTILGVITEINDRILVEQQPGAAIGDKVYFGLSHDLQVYQRINGDLHATPSKNLEVGQRVEVWAVGGVMESFPGQATADFIIIVGSDEESTDNAFIQPDREPDVSGTITQAINTVLIDQKYVVFITPTTQFLRRSGDTVEVFDARNIKEGQLVDIWADRVQGKQVIAQVIVVVDE